MKAKQRTALVMMSHVIIRLHANGDANISFGRGRRGPCSGEDDADV